MDEVFVGLRCATRCRTGYSLTDGCARVQEVSLTVGETHWLAEECNGVGSGVVPGCGTSKQTELPRHIIKEGMHRKV